MFDFILDYSSTLLIETVYSLIKYGMHIEFSLYCEM